MYLKQTDFVDLSENDRIQWMSVYGGTEEVVRRFKQTHPEAKVIPKGTSIRLAEGQVYLFQESVLFFGAEAYLKCSGYTVDQPGQFKADASLLTRLLNKAKGVGGVGSVVPAISVANLMEWLAGTAPLRLEAIKSQKIGNGQKRTAEQVSHEAAMHNALYGEGSSAVIFLSAEERGKKAAKAYMRLPYYDGGDLFSYLMTPLSMEERFELSKQLIERVQELENNSLIHGDLKPENIIINLNEEGKPRLKLVDFAFATLPEKQAEEQGEFPQRIKQQGTLGYCAPECLLKGSRRSFAEDRWSLAIILGKIWGKGFNEQSWEKRSNQLLTCGNSESETIMNTLMCLNYASRIRCSIYRALVLFARYELTEQQRSIIVPPLWRIILGLLNDHPARRLSLDQAMMGINLIQEEFDQPPPPPPLAEEFAELIVDTATPILDRQGLQESLEDGFTPMPAQEAEEEKEWEDEHLEGDELVLEVIHQIIQLHRDRQNWFAEFKRVCDTQQEDFFTGIFSSARKKKAFLGEMHAALQAVRSRMETPLSQLPSHRDTLSLSVSQITAHDSAASPLLSGSSPSRVSSSPLLFGFPKRNETNYTTSLVFSRGNK